VPLQLEKNPSNPEKKTQRDREGGGGGSNDRGNRGGLLPLWEDSKGGGPVLLLVKVNSGTVKTRGEATGERLEPSQCRAHTN